MDHNQLVNVEEVTSLKKLGGLGISFNKIINLPNLASHPNLSVVAFRFNQLSESIESVKAKLPRSSFSYGEEWLDEEYSLQNLNYTMDLTDPVSVEQINSNTVRIAGRIHMPAEKIKLLVEENLNDDESFETCFYADVNENGEFIFENLNLKKYGGARCDFRIGICYAYEKERDSYTDTSVRWYRIK